MNTSKLTVLVPSTAYLLAYTLPLLLASVLLIFAGSFLTLDRTRSFPPSEEYSSLPGAFDGKTKKRKISWRLEGGVGGLAVGYAFGVHLATFLAVLIPARTSSSPLSPKSFIAVWVLSCIPTTVLGGLRRHIALLFAGVGGGIAISLGLSIILHPSLLPRQVLVGVFTILLTGMLFITSFIPRLGFLLRPTLRISCSSLGSLGLVISIALLSRVMGWANAWERLWLPNGDPAEWGTPKEKGLSAAWAVFWAAGIASDWALRRWVGECPDEVRMNTSGSVTALTALQKWDSYLSKFMSDPPNRPDRAGSFQPLQSWWGRHFSTQPRKVDDIDDMIFPPDKAFPKPPGALPDTLYSLPPPKPVSPQFKNLRKKRNSTRSVHLDEEIDAPNSAAFLRKKPTKKERWKGMVERQRKKPVKFGTVEELSSGDSSSDEDEPEKTGDLELGVKDEKKGHVKRPFVIANPPSYSSDVSSAPTLVEKRSSTNRKPVIPSIAKDPKSWDVDIDYDKELERLQARLGSRELPTYSDDEGVDGKSTKTSAKSTLVEAPASPSWSPSFLQRHQRQTDQSQDLKDNVSPMVIPPVPGAVPLPATPSLIRAIDRIAVAQKEVFGSHAEGAYQVSPKQGDVGHGKGTNVGKRGSSPRRWDEFWKEVTVKAQS